MKAAATPLERFHLLGAVATFALMCATTAQSAIVLDNTGNAGQAGVATNLRTGAKDAPSGGCTKEQALYDKLCNSFNVADIQVVQRGARDQLVVDIGVNNQGSTSYNNGGTDSALGYFADGEHLFDLDKLRRAAAAMSQRSPDLLPGTYGEITWTQFIDNVLTGRTMYGMVRVLAPLAPGAAGVNALGNESPVIYGFCSTQACACAPSSSTDIKPGATVCGKTVPTQARIEVRGSLLIDFVDYATGSPVLLSQLPFSPRELYFKVAVPIQVNAANDLNADGALDNIDDVAALTSSARCTRGQTTCSAPVSLAGLLSVTRDVPAESQSLYQYRVGRPLTQAEFDALTPADQYSLLLPSGYAQGWLDAFNALGITPAEWRALGFDPGTDAATFTLDAIRSDRFEDIPAYMYTGGLVDMHHHVNISGLVYVPQAMELEQTQLSSRQYVSGAVIVRDSFYIQDKGGVTLLSADADSVSKIRVATAVPRFTPYTGSTNSPPVTSSTSSTSCGRQPPPPPSCGTQRTDDNPEPPSEPGLATLNREWVEIRAR